MLSLESTCLLVQQLQRTYSNHRLFGICPPNPPLRAPPPPPKSLPTPQSSPPKVFPNPLGFQPTPPRPPRAVTRFKGALTPASPSKSSTPMPFPLSSASSICI